mmetsp:Transcript_15866/g.49324  ORF Transcript_15866/g.49324 Transcript_15866/m.49324 type:complete len:211 (-) Transcript_15866:13-645(-)
MSMSSASLLPPAPSSPSSPSLSSSSLSPGARVDLASASLLPPGGPANRCASARLPWQHAACTWHSLCASWRQLPSATSASNASHMPSSSSSSSSCASVAAFAPRCSNQLCTSASSSAAAASESGPPHSSLMAICSAVQRPSTLDTHAWNTASTCSRSGSAPGAAMCAVRTGTAPGSRRQTGARAPPAAGKGPRCTRHSAASQPSAMTGGV